MKRLILSTVVLASMAGTIPASAQEITYVEDCAQGILLNPNKDNWFITARGGANFSLGPNDSKAPFKDRIGSTASIFAGKWLTPTFGLRFGASMSEVRGATSATGFYVDQAHGQFDNGFYHKKYYAWGVEVDGLINMTNWIMGYKKGRVYNAVVHGGVGSMWALRHEADGKGGFDWSYKRHNRVFYVNLGLQNNFNLGKGFEAFIDIEGQANDWARVDYLVNLTAGITYNFPKREWDCPITAVCPTRKYTDAEGDALQAQLADADNRIAQLQNELDNCRKRPVANTTMSDCDGLATIYYPINVSALSKSDKSVLTAIAQVMKSNPETRYQLTGWADNYTGNENINTRLRHARVDGVKAFLIGCGVNPSQLESDINNSELTQFGARAASLDRAVTIKEIK